MARGRFPAWERVEHRGLLYHDCGLCDDDDDGNNYEDGDYDDDDDDDEDDVGMKHNSTI